MQEARKYHLSFQVLMPGQPPAAVVALNDRTLDAIRPDQVARTETAPFSANPEFLNKVFILRLSEPLGNSLAPKLLLHVNLFAMPSIDSTSAGRRQTRAMYDPHSTVQHSTAQHGAACRSHMHCARACHLLQPGLKSQCATHLTRWTWLPTTASRCTQPHRGTVSVSQTTTQQPVRLNITLPEMPVPLVPSHRCHHCWEGGG